MTTLSPQPSQEAILARATVFIVDDDPAMCESLSWLIESIGLKARTFTSAAAFLKEYDFKERGCVVTDVRMPGMSGLELHAKLAATATSPPVILITGHGDVPMAVRAMRHGAFDFLEKPFNDQALLERIQQAIILDHQQREQARLSDQHQAKLASLTARERQVLDLVVRARLNKQIASILDLSEKTIETHRANVMKKMHAATVVELVRMVMKYAPDSAGDAMDSR